MTKFHLENTQEFSIHNAYYLSLLANAAYKKPEQIEIELQKLEDNPKFTFYDCPTTHTQAFLFETDDDVVVSFRGTQPTNFQDILTDIDARKTNVFIYHQCVGNSHQGFTIATDSVFSNPFRNRENENQEPILTQLKSILEQSPNKKVWFTGHSLGAALASVAIVRFHNESYFANGLYTFGSPRCFDNELADKFDQLFGHCTYRIVNKNDIVTCIPGILRVNDNIRSTYFPRNENLLHIADWKHVGKEIYIAHDDTLAISPSKLKKYKDLFLARCCSCLYGKFFSGLTDHDMTYYSNILNRNYQRESSKLLSDNEPYQALGIEH